MTFRHRTTWTDARGIEWELHDMETSHVENVVALLQRRKTALLQVKESYEKGAILPGLDAAIARADSAIDTFVEELERRTPSE